MSERAHAKEVGIPRTTMRSWERRRRELRAQGVPEFFETKEGVEWASRLVWAPMFVMSLRCPTGLRCICEVLELSGLDAVVAGSFDTLQGMAVTLHETVDGVGAELQQELADRCAKRGPSRCARTRRSTREFVWSRLSRHRTSSLLKNMLSGAMPRRGRTWWKRPHVQHELVRGTSLPLRSRERRATEALVKAMAAVRKTEEMLAESKRTRRRRGRPKNYAKLLDKAERAERRARAVALHCAADREAMSGAIRGISYHPYDLATGTARPADDLAALITESFDKINEIANRTGLSAKCCKRIDKAARVVDSMLETMARTHAEMRIRLSVVELAASERSAVERLLIPQQYIGLAAAKAQTADKRNELQLVADRLTAEFAATTKDWPGFTEARLAELTKVAMRCAQAFQRSSSCVEGRNGHLALFHHGIHRLTPAKLRALTVTHNFHIIRVDGARFYPPSPYFSPKKMHIITICSMIETLNSNQMSR